MRRLAKVLTSLKSSRNLLTEFSGIDAGDVLVMILAYHTLCLLIATEIIIIEGDMVILGLRRLLNLAALSFLRYLKTFWYTGKPLLEAVYGPEHRAHFVEPSGVLVHSEHKWLSPYSTLQRNLRKKLLVLKKVWRYLLCEGTSFLILILSWRNRSSLKMSPLLSTTLKSIRKR